MILIVEDDDISCVLFKELFEQENIKSYLIVKSGEQAIEICKRNSNIGLVLMDIKLPGINGCEALKIIRKIRKNLPVIVQTACIMSGAEDIYLKLGFDDFISKPINNNELMKLIYKYHEPVLTKS
jgi:two-component system cell cycle response regulator DivK